MNYQDMSDFEINKAVAHHMGLDFSGVTEENQFMYNMKDYCNSWADAGQIIQENGIELSYDGISWSARSTIREIGWFSDWRNYPESPCRLAMIVFLMTKGDL